MFQRGRYSKTKFLILGLAMVVGLAAFPYARLTVKNPLAITQPLAVKEVVNIVDSLMHNMYRAFDRRQEELIYDQLATSIAGDLLRDIYLQTQQQIQLADQGGARIKIEHVEIQAVDEIISDKNGIDCRCAWNVLGTVGHWGHLHRRKMGYEANMRIEPIDEAWKIRKMQIVNQSQPVVVDQFGN